MRVEIDQRRQNAFCRVTILYLMFYLHPGWCVFWGVFFHSTTGKSTRTREPNRYIYIYVCVYVCIMYLFIYITDFDFLWFPNHPIQDLQDQAQPSKYIEVIGLMSPPTCVGIGSWGMVAKCCEILRLLVDGLSHCNSIISMGISGS